MTDRPNPRCHSQGELLYYLEKNNPKEIVIDPQLPGSLSIDSLVKVIGQKHPDTKVGILKEHLNKPIIYAAAAVLIIQAAFNLAIQFSTLTIQQVTYSGIATAGAFFFYMGGIICFRKKQ